MTLLHALILGIIEGITEFLPVSSTGHLILAAKLLHLPETEFQKSFDIVIQLGAILAVALLYGRTLLRSRALLLGVFVAFLPTAVIGLLLHGLAKRYLLGNTDVVLWSLFLGGVFLIVFERWHQETETIEEEAITLQQAVVIGLFQSLAIIPGVSRSAATVVGGLLLGLRRKTIIDFSFLLAVPTMLAATALDLLKTGTSFTADEYGLLGAGLLTSFLVALAAISWLLRFIKHHSFSSFGVYRILLAIAFWMFVAR
jgi:undecaprenyl-diphosphatase